MRYVVLTKAKPGMILASNVYDAEGRTLISKNGELTTDYITRLFQYGFHGVYIADELSEDIQVEDAISVEIRLAGQKCVREKNIEGCKTIAQMIVEEILEKGVVSLDLTDLRSYDDYTFAHSVNVAVYSCVIGMGIGLEEKQLADLVMAALFHDLGKLTIPLEVLNKPGRLTPEEFDLMKTHAQKSYDLIGERWDVPASVKVSVLSHHENVDGTGYPHGTDGDQQSKYTKILHVADVYDALISKRPYKNPYSPYEAAEYMMGACGILFDKDTVDALLRYVPLFPKGTQVMLSDGRSGIIYFNKGIHNLRPVIKLFDGSLLDLTETENLGLTIKQEDREEADAPLLQKSEDERKEMIKEYQKSKILIVDDMMTNLKMLEAILEDSYQITLAKSGEQAMLYMNKGLCPDLIIMDIDMPGMNGIETARQIKDMMGEMIPILFVSALCDRETVSRCKELNAAGYIIRPYKAVFIKSEVKRILFGWNEE